MATTRKPAAKPAAKATARKATPAKATTAKAAAKAPAKATSQTAKLVAAAAEVARLRSELDAAVAHRNDLMRKARAAGMPVVDIQKACQFASSGAAQAAMASTR
jgi:hypothetical protein